MTKLTPEEIKRRLKEKKARIKLRKEERKRKRKEKREAKLKPKRELKGKLDNWKKAVIERDNYTCQRCNKNLTGLNKKGKPIRKHPHHIISFGSVISKYPELLEDIKNGILLCSQCHKFNNDSAHESGMEFTLWLSKNKPEQYNYLKDFLEHG